MIMKFTLVSYFVIAIFAIYICGSLAINSKIKGKPEHVLKYCKFKCALQYWKHYNKNTTCYTLPKYNVTVITCVLGCLEKIKSDYVTGAIECQCVNSKCTDNSDSSSATTTTTSDSYDSSDEDDSSDEYSEESEENEAQKI